LRALDPRQVLSRGYAWIADARGHAVTSVAQLQPGQEITATMADGEAAAQVLRTTTAR
jgi:exodeoxyribonuclease VII large subunit